MIEDFLKEIEKKIKSKEKIIINLNAREGQGMSCMSLSFANNLSKKRQEI